MCFLRFFIILLSLISLSLNAQNNQGRLNKYIEGKGLLKVEYSKENRGDVIVLINETHIDTIAKKEGRVVDVLYSDSLCQVLSFGSHSVYLNRYVKEDGKWSYCFSKYSNVFQSFSESGNILDVFFLNENGENIFILNRVFSGRKQATILKRIDSIYHQVYLSHNFISFQKSTIKDTLFQESKKYNYDMESYVRDSTLYPDIDNWMERRRLIKLDYVDLIFEKILSEEGFSFPSEEERNQVQKIAKFVSDSTGIYIRLVTKENLFMSISTKEVNDSVLVLIENPLQVKIADSLKEQDKFSWSFLSPELLSVTYPNNTQKIYYIYYTPTIRIPGVFPMESCPPRAFHSPVFRKE